MRRFLAAVAAAVCLALPASAAQSPGYVALTFDDGPSGRFTRELLDGLYDRGVKATFLLCGYRIRQYPDVAQRIYEEGHEIGFHGYSHKNMKNLSRRDIASEILDTEALLPAGCHPVFLRPPGGCCSDSVRQVAQARELAILGWSVDPRDWENHDTASVEKKVLSQVHDGDIILLHDMSDSSVAAALEIIDVLQEEGWEFLTVSELARRRGAELRPGRRYDKFPEPESPPQ